MMSWKPGRPAPLLGAALALVASCSPRQPEEKPPAGDTGAAPDTGGDADADTDTDTDTDADADPNYELVELAHLDGTGIDAVAWRPDGREVAIGLSSGGVGLWALWDLDTGELLTDEFVSGVTEIGYLPDGDGFMYAGGDALVVLDLDGNPIGEATGCDGGAANGYGISPDESALALGGPGWHGPGGEPSICTYSLADLRQTALERITADVYECDDVAYTPDGAYLVGLCETVLEAYSPDLSTWKARRDIASYHDGMGGHLVTSPLWPEWVFFSSSETHRLMAYRPADDTVAYGFAAAATIEAVAFTDDGGLAAVVLADGYAELWDGDLETRYARWSAGTDLTAVAFAPSGRYLATASAVDGVTLWEITSR